MEVPDNCVGPACERMEKRLGSIEEAIRNIATGKAANQAGANGSVEGGPAPFLAPAADGAAVRVPANLVVPLRLLGNQVRFGRRLTAV